ncbi:phospho-sugar mutase [Candidatus Binatia bacterium]|nr:phospho-sugar mutase [Candidatus Binatia bacterium]
MTLAEILAHLDALPVAAEHRQRARDNLTYWWTNPRLAAFRPQIEKLAERGKWDLLLDAFYRTIPFGTGGRRGPVGVGSNRVNPDTVLTSVAGHVAYLRTRFPGDALRVVVAFDVRVFRDLRGVYDPTAPNPLLGLRSRDLARQASAIYAAQGIEVWTVPADDGFYLSTPELSFAIRHLGAHGGLNVSASHNHPDDNGAKFYMPSGGQPVPPEDDVLAAAVEQVTEIPDADFDEAVRRGAVRWWDAAMHARYLDENLGRSVRPEERNATVAYSPLHGTGLHTVGDLLSRAGFAVHLVAPQAEPDGTFPAVPFRIANPEVPASMDLLATEAAGIGAELGLATDPDADRIGLVAPVGGRWRAVDGNEVAVLLTAYIIENRRAQGTLPQRGFVVKTAVTTDLVRQIADSHGVQVVGDLLVGFKYVGAVLDAIERDGRWGSVSAALDDFLFAAEESNGVLVSPNLRDKDAAGGALLLAEMCAWLRGRNRSFGDYLDEIHRRYGYAANLGYSLVMDGISGTERIARMMSALRAHPPADLNGHRFASAIDHLEESVGGPIRSDTDGAARNFVQLVYDGNLRVAVRPSGTEPKIKFYVERVCTPDATWAKCDLAPVREAANADVLETTLALVDALLRAVGVRLSRPALLVSPLLALEHRIDFGERFLPDLAARLAQDADFAELGVWVDTRLAKYGTDARALVAPGVAAHFKEQSLESAVAQRLAALFPTMT